MTIKTCKNWMLSRVQRKRSVQSRMKGLSLTPTIEMEERNRAEENSSNTESVAPIFISKEFCLPDIDSYPGF
jgi:hypothetical protein